MRILLARSFASIVIILLVTPLLAFAQADPFEVGGGYSPGESQSNTTLQIRSDTDWSGSYGDSAGSTTVDGPTLIQPSSRKKARDQDFLD